MNLKSTLQENATASHTDSEFLKAEILSKLAYSVGKDPQTANSTDWLTATILVVRDHIVDAWMATTRENYRAEKKRVYYLSLEFLIGRLLRDAMNNLQLTDGISQALSELNVDIDFIRELEPDAALGNGGLAVWPHVSWNPWPVSAYRRMATAFAMITACSAKRSKTALKWNILKTG